jgi:multidrug transporter EmrE-like cation transporter
VTLKDMALCAGFAVALPIGQVLFKFAAIYNTRLSGPLVVRLVSNIPLLAAFAWYGLTALVWFYILTRVPLSIAYSFTLAGSALVPLAAWLLFKEALDWRYAVGYLLMLAGFMVIQQSQRG